MNIVCICLGGQRYGNCLNSNICRLQERGQTYRAFHKDKFSLLLGSGRCWKMGGGGEQFHLTEMREERISQNRLKFLKE